MFNATFYCQDFENTERYDYGSAYGKDRVSFAADLERHLKQCAHHARRVVAIVVTEDTGGPTVTRTEYPTNAKPGHLPDIAAVLSEIVPFPQPDHDTEDCPYCDGTGDNRTDPDYSYPAACYACGGSGISRVTATDRGGAYPWHGIAWWAYDADVHCNAHAIARFGEAGLFDPETADAEGNPIRPVFTWDEGADENCAECIAAALAARCRHCYGTKQLHHPAGHWYPCDHCQPASHSDQDIDNRTDDCPIPAVMVTAAGPQYMLPGETPPPAKKGGAEQNRMF